jgi:DNA-binding response OmpR family regulator
LPGVNEGKLELLTIWHFRVALRTGSDYNCRVSPHILFVDDEAPIRELLSLYFRKKGFTVTTAINTGEARRLADSVGFDLGIFDVDIAGENGLELLSLFKSRFPALPIIMFTGLAAEPDLMKQALAAGASGFLRKTEPLPELYAEACRHLKIDPA